MRYVEFKDVIHNELRQSQAGLTWQQLKERLDLPYDRACPEWVGRLESEIGLTRAKGSGRAHVWKIKPSAQSQRSRS